MIQILTLELLNRPLLFIDEMTKIVGEYSSILFVETTIRRFVKVADLMQQVQIWIIMWIINIARCTSRLIQIYRRKIVYVWLLQEHIMILS